MASSGTELESRRPWDRRASDMACGGRQVLAHAVTVVQSLSAFYRIGPGHSSSRRPYRRDDASLVL